RRPEEESRRASERRSTCATWGADGAPLFPASPCPAVLLWKPRRPEEESRRASKRRSTCATWEADGATLFLAGSCSAFFCGSSDDRKGKAAGRTRGARPALHGERAASEGRPYTV